MRYVKARLDLYKRDEAYRIYVSEGIKVLAGLNMTYAELLEYKPETRTAGEIINGIREKLS